MIYSVILLEAVIHAQNGPSRPDNPTPSKQRYQACITAKSAGRYIVDLILNH